MPLWKKLWLLFSVIWVVVAALNVFTILAFGEDVAPEKAFPPLFFGFAVPAALFGLGWIWERWNKRRRNK